MRRLRVATVLIVLAAVPGLIISGAVVLFANPCFFRQFPQAGCPQASLLGGSAGWKLIWGGVALLAVLGLIGALAKSSRKGTPESPAAHRPEVGGRDGLDHGV